MQDKQEDALQEDALKDAEDKYGSAAYSDSPLELGEKSAGPLTESETNHLRLMRNVTFWARIVGLGLGWAASIFLFYQAVSTFCFAVSLISENFGSTLALPGLKLTLPYLAGAVTLFSCLGLTIAIALLRYSLDHGSYQDSKRVDLPSPVASSIQELISQLIAAFKK